MKRYHGADFEATCTMCAQLIRRDEPRWYDEEKRLYFHDACYAAGYTQNKPPAVPAPSTAPIAEVAFRPASSYRDPLPPHATVELEVETIGDAVTRRVLRVRLSLGAADPGPLTPTGEALRKQAEQIALSWLKEERA